jgi:peptidoglycan/xylan/chitin deacetylase (PgdA/CDA1 family)
VRLAVKGLALKVDVDTLRGYVEGVPRLLDLFGSYGIRASIFFSFGPDNSGKAIRRIFRRGFLSKMLRTKAPTTYGFKTLLYGTLLPAPMIVESAPHIFRRACEEGHDCGVHAWDHVHLQDRLHTMPEEEFSLQYAGAAKIFTELSGKTPVSYAAPGWQVSSGSLLAEERLNLKYASDTRGRSPFFPTYRGRRFAVPQIPTTLPTMDEILGSAGVTDQTLPDLWMSCLHEGWNVLTVHAEMEGISKLCVFENFLKKSLENEVSFITLSEIADTAEMETSEVVTGSLPGRAGSVALQGVSVKNGGGL